MTTTFITAIFDIYKDKDKDVDIRKTKEKRISKFEELAATGIQIVLFCCPVYEKLLQSTLNKYLNVKLLAVINLEDLLVYKLCLNYEKTTGKQLTLPLQRNTIKDTREYMILINSKVEFIQTAIKLNIWNSNYFCWIDFSILYVFPEREKPLLKIKYISNEAVFNMKDCIITPGYYDKNNNDYLNTVNWRFFGGLLIGDKTSLLNFTNNALTLFSIFLNMTNKLVWETSYWHFLEQNNYFNPQWYFARFNDSIINNIPL